MQKLTEIEMSEINGGFGRIREGIIIEHLYNAAKDIVCKAAHDLTENRDRHPRNRDKVRRERQEKNRERRDHDSRGRESRDRHRG